MNCAICETRYGYMSLHPKDNYEKYIQSVIHNFSNYENLIKEAHILCFKCLIRRAFNCDYCVRPCERLINIQQIIYDFKQYGTVIYDNPEYIYFDKKLGIIPKVFYTNSDPYIPVGAIPGQFFHPTIEWIEARSKENPNLDPEMEDPEYDSDYESVDENTYDFRDYNQPLPIEPQYLPTEMPHQNLRPISKPDTQTQTHTHTQSHTLKKEQSHTQPIKKVCSDKEPFPYHLLHTITKYYYESEFAIYVKDILKKKYDKYFSISDISNMMNVGWYIKNNKPLEYPDNRDYTYILNLMKETFDLVL